MAYLLGIDLGQCTVTAAVCHPAAPPHRRTGDPGWGAAEVAGLGATGTTISSALLLSAGGDLVAADVGAAHTADRATGFVHRVGDDVPVLLSGRAFQPQALVAGMVSWVAGRLWQLRGEAPDRIAVAHPTGWGAFRLGLLRTAFAEAGLGEPALVPRASAVVTGFRAAGRLPADGGVLAVVELDRRGLEISLVNPHDAGRYEIITSVRSTDITGAELDDAEAATRHALVRSVVDLAERTMAACGVPVTDLSAVLLAGSAAVDPLLTDVITAVLPIAVLRLDDPRTTVACGTALAVRPRTPRAVPSPPMPEPATAGSATAAAPVVAVTRPVTPGLQAALQPPRPPVRVTAAPATRR